MGETQNTKATGDARITMLCHNKKLDAKYKGKKYAELAACDQQHIDLEYDKCMKEIRSAPMAAEHKKDLHQNYQDFKKDVGV